MEDRWRDKPATGKLYCGASMPSTFPPRQHVLLARDAPMAVILRRGPSKAVCSILWDRRNDTFTLGQWLRGRIYERRSDLSPDGRHLIYFAMNGKWDGETGGSWTAISRAPYLKAIMLLGKGDCWNGGGFFTGKGTYWLNDGYGHKPLLSCSAVTRDAAYKPASHFGGECPSAYYPRLLRDGWTLIGKEGAQLDSRTTFEKPLPHGWLLRKIAHEQVGAPPGKSCYWDEHELVRPGGNEVISKPNWEWAEWSNRSLLWTEKGCLYRSGLTATGLENPTLLKDFTEMKFEPLEAPY